MLRWNTVVGFCLCWMAGVTGLFAADAGLRASKPEVKREIVAIIEAQLAAFQKGDVKQAHGYAAAGFRAQRPLAEFAAIVRENYPEIWAGVRCEPGIVRDDGSRATVTVRVFSQESAAAYDYTLVKEGAGWRISGVLRHSGKRSARV